MQLRYLIMALGATAALAGCSASAVRTSDTSNARATYHLDCSGTFLSMQSCIDKADNICPRGYDVIDKDTKEVQRPKSQSSQDGERVGKELKEMDVRCR